MVWQLKSRVLCVQLQLTDADHHFQDIVRGYKERNIPLDTLVIDMDWHITFYNANHKDQVHREYAVMADV